MPPRYTPKSQRSLLLTLVILLGGGFIATSLLSYHASRDMIRDSIVNTELPLTSDTVYSEIQKDLIRPVLISSMMGRDTFLRDWAMSGEHNPEQVTRYLREVMEHNGAYTAFFVSQASQTYYQAKGVLKQVRPDEPRDAWYYRVRDMKDTYEINVDPDMANRDKLTFFINYKVFDYHDNFIGAAGVGLTVDAVVKLIDRYQQRYQRKVFFVDTAGRVMLTGEDGALHSAHIGDSLRQLSDLGELSAKLPAPRSGSYEYRDGERHFLNVRYIPELNWYLFVDKTENGALDDIRASLYLNLAICVAVLLLVLYLVSQVIRRFQARIEAQAMTDSLTGLPNRRNFDRLAGVAILQARREASPLTALLLDLDHFKQLNDTHGHLAGDQVLTGFAQDLLACLRPGDITCRWGGEEFLILLWKTGLSEALTVAENIRQQAECHTYVFEQQPLTVTVSLGLTALHADDTLDSLIARADQALYSAKQSGRNRVHGTPSEPA